MSLTYTVFISKDGSVRHEVLDEDALTDFRARGPSWFKEHEVSIRVDPVARTFAEKLAEILLASMNPK